MTAYIIVYSIIMLCLVSSVVAICVLYVRGEKRKLEKTSKKSAAANRGERAFLEAVGNPDSAAYIVIDENTRQPVYVSRNVSRFFGVSSEELLTDIDAAVRAVDKKYSRAFEREIKLWDGSGAFRQEFGYGDGKFALAEVFKAQNDGSSYLAISVRDITDETTSRKKMKKKLDSALEQAAAKSSFLSSMSHEIRTPMNGVMGMMSLARMNINDPEKVMGYLERAGDLSVFLLGMINDILDISKIESGKMQLFNTQIDELGYADKIKNMFNSTVTSKGINFNVESVGFTARYLIGDELRLTQVVTNLVSNANKFTPPGGNIDVTFKQLDAIGGKVQLMIRVRDTGKGIAPENIRKIMRPFEQEEASTAHNYGGTGLGLAICDNIVRMMDGNIVIDSTPGKGTDFSVFLSLPVADVKQDMDRPIESKPQEKEIDFSFDGCRILLAEDNEVNAEIAIEILSDEGAKVTLARDGREAVDIFVQTEPNSFDLLLLDIQMPRLNGREAASEIRKCKKSDAETVPIIALSADAFVEDVKLSEAAGMDGHVSKPVDFEELRKRAGEIIAAKKAANGEKL